MTKNTLSFQIKILTFSPKQTCNKEGQQHPQNQHGIWQQMSVLKTIDKVGVRVKKIFLLLS